MMKSSMAWSWMRIGLNGWNTKFNLDSKVVLKVAFGITRRNILLHGV